MGLTDPSKRLEAIEPYMFAELERKVAEKRAAGIDVISLGIGDPDTPTYPHIVEAMQDAVADPGTHRYPSNRGREEFRRAFSDFYASRFGVDIDPETEVIPAIGAKECIYNLCFAFLDPGDVALAADPGYPVYTGGPLLAGAEAALLPLVPELASSPISTPSTARRAAPSTVRASCSSTTRTTPPAPSCPTASSSAWSTWRASTSSWSSTTTPTRRPPTTATSRPASSRPRARRTWAWRSSRSRRAST